MARSDPQVNFRLPENTLERLKEVTLKDRRTLTAQLTMIIEDWLEDRKTKEAKA
ncbi:Arc family DNA-binding protein [Acinetobacter sp. MN12]|uniref:Arc family DNA-binding protein n=1 Tax=Acinetobacter sp. MN12 TaxID=1513354 RepID=UPI00051B4385|nr:Arc family DNA-binding protein [Acinetobacter sp. MN12]